MIFRGMNFLFSFIFERKSRSLLASTHVNVHEWEGGEPLGVVFSTCFDRKSRFVLIYTRTNEKPNP